MTSRDFFSRKERHELIADEAVELREQARKMPPGVEQDRLLKRAQHLETDANLAGSAQWWGSKRPD